MDKMNFKINNIFTLIIKQNLVKNIFRMDFVNMAHDVNIFIWKLLVNPNIEILLSKFTKKRNYFYLPLN